MMNLISLLRKDASKRIICSASDTSLLSLLQVFESTNDVINYSVMHIGDNLTAKDKFLPNLHGFDKWIPSENEK